MLRWQRKVSGWLWRIARAMASVASRWDARVLDIQTPAVAPMIGYDFKAESFWWEITQHERWPSAIRTIASAEEAKLSTACRDAVYRRDFHMAVRYEGAATFIHDLPVICSEYAELYSKPEKNKRAA